MSLTIGIRFLTGRAHLHQWQSHHSEGRVEWPPSQWRLLRAIVAVAGRGLASLPAPDEESTRCPELDVVGRKQSAAKTRLARQKATSRLPAASAPVFADLDCDEIPLSRLAALLGRLSATPWIWLPRTGGGHTRQYFPIHEAGIVKNTGSAVFDTFAAVGKNHPLLFHWRDVALDDQQQLDLQLILGRMTYFGRAESWCWAQAYTTEPAEIPGIMTGGAGQTHWRCVCIEDGTQPEGKEYRDYTLERRLAPARDLAKEAASMLPRTKTGESKNRKPEAAEMFRKVLESETADKLLLRCLLRESGQDIKDGLERPIGTRWVHYAVSRSIYDLPRPKTRPRSREKETVTLVRYALNTATVGRPVLPAVTDTLLVADRFRSAVIALCPAPSPNLSGHEAAGVACEDNMHAHWWPVDEDKDGFIDHVMVWAPGGFEIGDVDALRRLTRLRQRGGRPDLLVTPTFVGPDSAYGPWQADASGVVNRGWTSTFVSATPYFCPVHLTHGRGRSGKARPIFPVLLESLRIQGLITRDEEVQSIQEIVFDYAPRQLAKLLEEVDSGRLSEPLPPRQYFLINEPPAEYPPLPRFDLPIIEQFRGASVKDPDAGYPLGLSVGLVIDHGSRFIRAMSFCRRRKHLQVKGVGRMFVTRFSESKPPRPFALGDQCHFGLGLFVPVVEDVRSD